jgi:hypothetical protein
MNSQKTIFAIVTMLPLSIALADDFKTLDGKEYKDAIVSHVEPDGIVVKSKSGISKTVSKGHANNVERQILISRNCTVFPKMCRAAWQWLLLIYLFNGKPPHESNFYGQFSTRRDPSPD